MESKKSIGQSLSNALTSIKTKGGNALDKTLQGAARFLRWSIQPVKNLVSYLVGRNKSDDVEKASPSSEEPVAHLSKRHISISDESTNTTVKKTTNDSEPESTGDAASVNKHQKPEKFVVSTTNKIPIGSEERKIVEEAAEFLNRELSGLLSRLPRVTLEDSRGVLTAYYQLIMLSEKVLLKGHSVHKAIRKLENHFQNTRQPDGFTDLQNTITLSIAHNIREQLKPDDYHQLLRRIKSNFGTLRYHVWQNVLGIIFHKGTSQRRSVHGHPRELVSPNDLELILDIENEGLLKYDGERLLWALKYKVEYDTHNAHARMNNLPDELRSLDLNSVAKDFKQYESLQSTLSAEDQNQDQDFKELEARCKVYRGLIAQGRAVLLDIQLHEGRRWDLKFFSQSEKTNDHTKRKRQMFEKLLDIDQLRGPQVDLAQLDWLIAQNNKAKRHLNVAIEGAGPTGLTLAFTQFQEGANVSVFEKRSTKYNRVQVVRLDPKWMDMLKFYLGEHYYDMFGQDGQAGKGIVRSDGFGEIVTHRLEEGLNHRLAELMARNYEHTSQSNDPQKTRLERLAAYEMTDVEDSKSGFTVQAKYNPQYDPSPFAYRKKNRPAGYQQPEALLSRPVDIVICAGGKNSQIRDKYMEDSVVTGAKNYGVCSWEGSKDQPIPNDRLDSFPDFRGMVVLDKEFHQFFREQMKFQLDKIEGLSSEERQFLAQQTDKQSSSVFNLEKSTFGRALQTRCFENKNLIYIGMEMPEEFNRFSLKVKNQFVLLPVPEFDQNGVRRSKDDQQEWRHKHAAILQKALAKAWFQTVAHSYDIDRSLGITQEKINDSFAAIFPVQQHRVKQNVIEKKSGSHDVVITVAGDAAANPHFMRYSGLTGARENALHLQNYTKAISRVKHNGPLEKLEEAQQRTGDFVIHRGEVFLGKHSRLKQLLGLYQAS